MKVGTTFKAATRTLKFVTILTARTRLPLCNLSIKTFKYKDEIVLYKGFRVDTGKMRYEVKFEHCLTEKITRI